jgi:signal transduction histidine kinase
LAVILTEFFIIGFGIHTYYAYRESLAARKHDLRVTELRGLIMQLDEVLTMSARMAAATGNLEWEKRYGTFEPQLDAAIKEAIQLSPASYIGQAAKQTDEANLKLIELERRSFNEVRAGRKEIAQQILFSEEYEQNKKIYAKGMSQFAGQLKESLDETARRESERYKIYFLITLAVAPGLFIGWLAILSAIRSREKELLETNQKLHQKTAELKEWNLTLDEKVRQKTAELEAAQHRLLQSEKMSAIGQLAGGVAHEINNPLGVILGFAQNLAKRVKPGDAYELPLKSIEREAVRCKNLVQDLLTFSRVGKGEKEGINLKETIEGALSLVLAQSKVKKIDLVKELSDIPPIMANRTQIQQVIIHLCNNAVDAMPQGGKLFVRLSKTKTEKPEAAEIQVQDTGAGIPAEIQSNIFNPFFTTKNIGRGTGLGLSLVYEIVDKHSGKISFESEIGKGTIFHVFLPIK